MLLFILATIQAILYGWVLGIERGEVEAHHGAHLRIPHFVQFILKYVTPAYWVVVFIGTIYTQGPSYWNTLRTKPVAAMSFGLILAVLALLLVLVHFAGRRWKAQGRL